MAGKKHDVLVACRAKRERFEELKDARRKRGGLVLNVFTKKGRASNKKAAAAKKAWKECVAAHDGATPRFYVHGYARSMRDIGIEGAPNPDSLPHKIVQTKKSDQKIVKAMKAKNLPDARVRAEKAAAANKIKNAAILGTRASATAEALRATANTAKGARMAANAADTVTGILLAFPDPVISKGTAGIVAGVSAGTRIVAGGAEAGARVSATKAEQKYQDEVLRVKAALGKKASEAEVARMNAEIAETERLALEAARARLKAQKEEEARIDWYEDPTTWIAVGLGLAAFAGVGMFARRK
jgi:hypothetical protein